MSVLDLLRRARVEGRLMDVLLAHGRVTAMEENLRASTIVRDCGAVLDEVVDLDGAVLLPGPRDEHVHLEQWRPRGGATLTMPR